MGDNTKVSAEMDRKTMPAFPFPAHAAWGGMTLRDYFAAQAVPSLVLMDGAGNPEDVARAAYAVADAMLVVGSPEYVP